MSIVENAGDIAAPSVDSAVSAMASAFAATDIAPGAGHRRLPTCIDEAAVRARAKAGVSKRRDLVARAEFALARGGPTPDRGDRTADRVDRIDGAGDRADTRGSSAASIPVSDVAMGFPFSDRTNSVLDTATSVVDTATSTVDSGAAVVAMATGAVHRPAVIHTRGRSTPEMTADVAESAASGAPIALSIRESGVSVADVAMAVHGKVGSPTAVPLGVIETGASADERGDAVVATVDPMNVSFDTAVVGGGPPDDAVHAPPARYGPRRGVMGCIAGCICPMSRRNFSA